MMINSLLSTEELDDPAVSVLGMLKISDVRKGWSSDG
jgi:hypothetical protein